MAFFLLNHLTCSTLIALSRYQSKFPSWPLLTFKIVASGTRLLDALQLTARLESSIEKLCLNPRLWVTTSPAYFNLLGRTELLSTGHPRCLDAPTCRLWCLLAGLAWVRNVWSILGLLRSTQAPYGTLHRIPQVVI